MLGRECIRCRYVTYILSLITGQNVNEGNNFPMINIDIDLPLESSPGVTSSTSLSDYVTGLDLDKESHSYMVNEDKSPPISARLRELSNNLRLICSSTPLSINIPESDAPYGSVSTEVMEPETPNMERSLRVYDEQDVTNPTTPWETFSKRSTGVKVG